MEEKQEKSRIDRQFDFIREIDKEKFITRQTFLSDAKRRENDAEHAWHMAIMTLLLSEYANEEIDVLRVISMLLIHDLVEIDAGDTYAYDEEGKQTQRVREVKAADRIYGILPEDQGEKLRELWEEFEEAQTPEAKFAHVIHRRKRLDCQGCAVKPDTGTQCTYSRRFTKTVGLCIYKLY